jgi:hypothetical protein
MEEHDFGERLIRLETALEFLTKDYERFKNVYEADIKSLRHSIEEVSLSLVDISKVMGNIKWLLVGAFVVVIIHEFGIDVLIKSIFLK